MQPFNLETPFEDIVIDETPVLSKLLALKISKYPGPDLFHARLLKEVAHEIAFPLTMIYQKPLILELRHKIGKWSRHSHF